MKVWTIQSSQVYDILSREGFYQPNFYQSTYLEQIPELTELYHFVLESFNQINQCSLPGLVFGFMKSDNSAIYSINSIDEFLAFLQEKTYAMGSLIRNICKTDSLIMELEYPEQFNPIFIDINDFQALMPPMGPMQPYTYLALSRLIEHIAQGQIGPSVLPSGVIQAHLPYISMADHVVDIYRYSE